MYSASGFWSMGRYGLPILTLIWNNLNYQTVRTNFHTFGGEMAKRQKCPDVYLGEPEIDFVMLAKAQGIQGSEVGEPRDLGAALRRGVDAITAGEPYVLDVRVAPWVRAPSPPGTSASSCGDRRPVMACEALDFSARRLEEGSDRPLD
jgi:benzoylformate decarboxylase